MKLTAALLGAKKAIGALTIGEAAAVEAGLIGNATAGYITAGLGVVSAVVVYLLDNGPSKPSTVINQTIVSQPKLTDFPLPEPPATPAAPAAAPPAPATPPAAPPAA